MKSKLPKKLSGQVQTMGKGGIQDIANNNSIQSSQNMAYNQVNYQMNPIYQNQMQPYNNQMMMYNMQQNNAINMGSGGMNITPNSQNGKKLKRENSGRSNPIVENAKMIINTPNSNSSNNNKNRSKAQSAKRNKDESKDSISYSNMGYDNNLGLINNNLQPIQINPSQNMPVMMANNYQNFNNQNNHNPLIKDNMNNNGYGMNNKRSAAALGKPKISNYKFIEYQPYTLKDYKELTRNPVVMGHLGANIGTKEWEEKRNKMKKMQSYSNNINKEHTGIKSLKKETPSDEIEKLTKQKIENSIRYRTYEYGKLVRAGYNNQPNGNKYDKNDLGAIPEGDDDLYLKRYADQLKDETENIFNPPPPKPKEEPKKIQEPVEDPYDLDKLLKQKEAYKVKIQGIRDSLLD